jgi:23S rRNA (cytidine1920-2'-O)/16S rRNA (cytidine1409-2'-O)-methyltransferase
VARKSAKRLDVALVERGLVASRSRARALVLAGQVRVDGQPVTKAGAPVTASQRLEVAVDPNPYVSRGGLKLAAALDSFALDPTGRTAVDVGASTGGFTDCLLQRGAARVYAVDVGYGQLAWKLRRDERVVVVERTNARRLTREHVPERCSLAVVDVSFISTAKVLPAVLPLLTDRADLLVLVKPQFEAERRQVGKGGVIRDESLRNAVIDAAIARLEALGLEVHGRMDSPVHGPKGNVECLVWLRKTVHS